jgi:hypothetical protein
MYQAPISVRRTPTRARRRLAWRLQGRLKSVAFLGNAHRREFPQLEVSRKLVQNSQQMRGALASQHVGCQFQELGIMSRFCHWIIRRTEPDAVAVAQGVLTGQRGLRRFLWAPEE